MNLKLTKEELDLLQTILCCLKNDQDWIIKDWTDFAIASEVLIPKNEVDSSIKIINSIYDKLF
jgi:hypothetical protein